MSAVDWEADLHSKTRAFTEEAANLSKDDLIARLRPHFRDPANLNRSTIQEVLFQKKKSRDLLSAKEGYLKQGTKSYLNLVWPPIFLEKLLDFYPDTKREQSKDWFATHLSLTRNHFYIAQARENQNEWRQAPVRPYGAAHHDYVAYTAPSDMPPAPSAARSFGNSSGGSRGAHMAATATARQPNPSTLAHSGGGGRGGGSFVSATTKNILSALPWKGKKKREAEEMKQCVGCEKNLALADLVEEDCGFICLPCKQQNLSSSAVALQPLAPKRAKVYLQQQPLLNSSKKMQTVPASNFGAGYGGGGGGSAMAQPPKLTSGANSLRGVLHTAQGDAKARAPASPAFNYIPPPPRHRRQSAKKALPPSPGDNADHPIELLDSDEEGQAGAAAAAAAPAAAKQEGLRPRRAAAAALASVTERLAGLKCTIPPEGGPGSVEFTASDMARLGPEEFLNDTAIDYYLRWLHLRLQVERPVDARRCYFFNTFFYKKLTEKEGGKLPVWAEGLALKPKELQALRNYEKVKKWTRKVDIFDKDFVFVPIHDHLHWSLMVICHPAAAFAPKLPQRPRGRASQSSQPEAGEGEDPRLRPEPSAFILHLDSLEGSGHSAPAITKVLQAYLKSEWKTKAEGDEDSVPKRWQAARPGKPLRDFSPLMSFAPSVPRQNNYCDCGLYVCAFTEFFTFAMPPALNARAVAHLDRQWQDGIDLWEGSEDGRCYPGFLTRGWFKWPNASNLRWDMAHLVLGHMGVQCQLMDGEERREEGRDDVDPERLGPIVCERQRMSEIMAEAGYHRPAEWRYHGQAQKEARRQRFLEAQKERARKDEEARAEAAAAALAREQRQQSRKKLLVLSDSDSDSGAGGGVAVAGAAAVAAAGAAAASQDDWGMIAALPDNSQRGGEEEEDLIDGISLGDDGDPMDAELPLPHSLQPTAAAAAFSEGIGNGEPAGQFIYGGHPYGGQLDRLPAADPSPGGEADINDLLDPHDDLLGSDVPRGPRTSVQALSTQPRGQQQRQQLPFESSFGAHVARDVSEKEGRFEWPAGGLVEACYEEGIERGAPPPNLEYATLVAIERGLNKWGDVEWCRLGVEYCTNSSIPFFTAGLRGRDALSRIFSDWLPLWANLLPPDCARVLPEGSEMPSAKLLQRAQERQMDHVMEGVRRCQQQRYTQEREEEEAVEATQELESGEEQEDGDVVSPQQGQQQKDYQQGTVAGVSADEDDDPIDIVDGATALRVAPSGGPATTSLSPGHRRRQDYQNLRAAKAAQQPLSDNDEGAESPPRRGVGRNRKPQPSRGGGGGGGGGVPHKAAPWKNAAGAKTEKGAAMANLFGKLKGDLAASGRPDQAADQQRAVKKKKTKAGVGSAAEKRKAVDVVDMTDD